MKVGTDIDVCVVQIAASSRSRSLLLDRLLSLHASSACCPMGFASLRVRNSSTLLCILIIFLVIASTVSTNR